MSLKEKITNIKNQSEGLECDVLVFRPKERPDLCRLYVNGHHQVLEDHGLVFLTSKEDYWCNFDSGYAILAVKGRIPLGGVRLEKLGEALNLPLQRALKNHESEIKDYLDRLPYSNSFEACGLWNSRIVAGYDLAVFLSRLCIALAPTLDIDTVLSLNGLYTYRIPRELGLRMVTELGENGFFKYPIERFHSALWIHEDLDELKYATIQARSRIISLRENINQNAMEQTKKGRILIHYKSLL